MNKTGGYDGMRPGVRVSHSDYMDRFGKVVELHQDGDVSVVWDDGRVEFIQARNLVPETDLGITAKITVVDEVVTVEPRRVVIETTLGELVKGFVAEMVRRGKIPYSIESTAVELFYDPDLEGYDEQVPVTIKVIAPKPK